MLAAGLRTGTQGPRRIPSPVVKSMTERDALRALRAVRAQVFETHRQAFRFWRDNDQPARAAAQRRLAEKVRAEVLSYDRRIREKATADDAGHP